MVTGLTVSRGAGSVTVVTTSATVAAEVVVIAVNLNQCHEVFSSLLMKLLYRTPLYTPTFHHHVPHRNGSNRLCTPEYITHLGISRISKNAHYSELS